MSCSSSRESLRRFAHEIMPSFSDEPARFRTVPARQSQRRRDFWFGLDVRPTLIARADDVIE
jgi:hypothetical protein